MKSTFLKIYMDVVGRHPILVVCVALALGGAYVLFGERISMRGTVVSARFTASAFASLRQGMTEAEVEGLMGPPLRKVRGDERLGAAKGEMWHYSDRTGDTTARFWRRWVHLVEGKVDRVLD